jgi:hypothetical protein
MSLLANTIMCRCGQKRVAKTPTFTQLPWTSIQPYLAKILGSTESIKEWHASTLDLKKNQDPCTLTQMADCNTSIRATLEIRTKIACRPSSRPVNHMKVPVLTVLHPRQVPHLHLPPECTAGPNYPTLTLITRMWIISRTNTSRPPASCNSKTRTLIDLAATQAWTAKFHPRVCTLTTKIIAQVRFDKTRR